MKKILVTGAAGFIGYHVCRQLLGTDCQILGIDNLNSYYSLELKKSRLQELEKIQKMPSEGRFQFEVCDLNEEKFQTLWQEFQPQIILHFAAQAGVRYSFEAPEKYLTSNVSGFFQVLECSKKWKPEHLIYATSSSVYGNSTPAPFSVEAKADQPISIYAATKRSNELFASAYSHLFEIPMTGLRFFTVYGSYGRPDMAYFKFTESILKGNPLTVFNYENQQRDFTHVFDIVESIKRLIPLTPKKTDREVQSGTQHRLLNIGASSPTPLREFVETLESLLGKKAVLKHAPAQPGDVDRTYADVSSLEKLTQYRPRITLREGLQEFSEWYKRFYR